MAIPGLHGQARLGRYELLARLASGGMGEIFLARLEGAAGFEKLFVIKRILPHLADDARFRQMLIAEARIASRLAHANICQVYELGETDGQLYIVMEYLDGVTLLPLLRRASRLAAPLDLGLFAAIVQHVCDALHYAHELRDRGEPIGLVHRDVTPSNIFMTESGVVKVLDFGIAKARGASTNTQEGTVKGKYAYMAPEQLRGAEIDRRVDLFALGIVMFEMLALRRLFQRTTDYLTFRAVMEQPIPDVRQYRPDVPEPLAHVIARALARDPAQRFDSARQLGTSVIDALGGKRPWTQGELGDFVHATFGDALQARSAVVSDAVHGPPTVVQGLRAVPVIPPAGPDDHEADRDDDFFPPVETAVDPSPPPEVAGSAMPRSQPGDFVEGTPPPFAADITGGGPRADAVASAPVTVARSRSNVMWPLLAVGMVAVAGVALYLVYEQSQRPQTPTSVVIQQAPDDRAPVIRPADPVMPPEPPAPATGSDSAGSDVRKPAVRPPPVRRQPNPYLAAIEPHLASLSQCLHDHQEVEMPTTASASIVIAANGHARSVTWKPDLLNASELGGCLKHILMTTAFPTSAGDATITWSPGFSRSR